MTVGVEMPEEVKRMSSTTAIANSIRRSGRRLDTGSGYREIIERMVRDGSGPRAVYQAGQQEGRMVVANNLADVLYACQQADLGRLAVIEESNCHVVFRVKECLGCRTAPGQGCRFVAGFLAGALEASGRFADVEVQETSCDDYPGRTCVFRADLRIRD